MDCDTDELIDCEDNEPCQPGSPATCECTPEWTSGFYGGDVWSYSSCTGRQERLDECEACETCRDMSGGEAECRPTVTQAYFQCGDDGNVHWFDSCDLEGRQAFFCGGPQCANGCENTSATTARCVILDDFTPCTLVTDPDRSYDICVDGICVSPGCGDASCNTPGPHFPLPDTNQRRCYNESGPVTCPNPGEDFYGQDAQYGWDMTLDETERFSRSAARADQPVVTDTVTTLVWQGCAAGLSGDVCGTGNADKCTWKGALRYCEDLTWGAIATGGCLIGRSSIASPTRAGSIPPLTSGSSRPHHPADFGRRRPTPIMEATRGARSSASATSTTASTTASTMRGVCVADVISRCELLTP